MRISLLILSAVIFICSCNQHDGTGHKPASITDSVYGEKTACMLSQIAYSKNIAKDLQQYMPDWQLVWDGAERGGNHAFLATNGEGYALGIRGSLLEFSWAAFQNWVYQDLNVMSLKNWEFTNDSSKAKIAQGSWDGWQNLNNMTDKTTGKTLLAVLEEKTKDNTPILITGHSLGGNLATAYASYLWQYLKNKKKENNNINVITFAAPAAGNAYFAKDFNKKFPHSLRFENSNDMVPKFPCTPKIESLGELYDSIPSASTIMVGYKNVTVSLSRVFFLLNTAMNILEFTTSNADYTQPAGNGNLFTNPLSGNNKSNDIVSWLAEAGYQHGMAQYAAYLNAPVVK
jgi:triacylglycerol lipase